MTWEEFVKLSKKYGYKKAEASIFKDFECFDADDICFDKNGTVSVGFEATGVEFSRNRTPDQMYQIMLALED